MVGCTRCMPTHCEPGARNSCLSCCRGSSTGDGTTVIPDNLEGMYLCRTVTKDPSYQNYKNTPLVSLSLFFSLPSPPHFPTPFTSPFPPLSSQISAKERSIALKIKFLGQKAPLFRSNSSYSPRILRSYLDLSPRKRDRERERERGRTWAIA